MSSEKLSDVAASVKQRLLNYSREQKSDFNLVQTRYAVERLLYRVAQSNYANDFLLKGAMLFVLWETNPHRPTKDVDLLFLPEKDAQALEQIFKTVCSVLVEEDGLVFQAESVKAEEIREDNAYGGIRVKLLGLLGSSKITVQIDIGLGNAVYPEPEWIEFPTILNFPAPRIRPYPIYTVVAEKFQAMVKLGLQNSRMKDYYDLFYLLNKFSFNGRDLKKALTETFRRRHTPLPTVVPSGLSDEFSSNLQKQTQWNAFLRKNALKEEEDLSVVVRTISAFIMPVLIDEDIKEQVWLPNIQWH